MNRSSCSSVVELSRYIDWFISDHQATQALESQTMVNVGHILATTIRSSVLERMTCNGAKVMDLVEQQEYAEAESLMTWKTPVEATAPIVAVFVAFMLAYTVYQ